jgi:CBS domain containing-hemolysin-like protein
MMESLIASINWATRKCLRMFGVSWQAGSESTVGESNIRLILREGFDKGLFGEHEKKMLHSIFEFSDTTVRRAMTPRTEIVAIDINDPADQILKLVTEERFSRYPVYEDSIDNIKGIIHSRDLLFVFTQKELFVLKDIIRAAHFVPDSKPIAELMREMNKSKFHMAIVLDEFGGTGGIITMEDVIEEIVGDIQDEYDLETSKIVFTQSGVAKVKASMPIDEFANEFGVEVEEGEFDTVGGMIVTRLGRIPVKGEKTAFAGFTLKVVDKDGHRIKSVIAEKTTKAE